MDTRLRPRHRLRAAASVHALWQPCYWPWRSSRWVICTTCGECRLARRACAADPRSGPSTASPSACAGQPCPVPAPAFPYQLRAPGRSGGLPRALSHPRRGRHRPVRRARQRTHHFRGSPAGAHRAHAGCLFVHLSLSFTPTTPASTLITRWSNCWTNATSSSPAADPATATAWPKLKNTAIVRQAVRLRAYRATPCRRLQRLVSRRSQALP